MGKVTKIKSKIEELVKLGEVKKGEIISVHGLSEDTMLFLSVSFAGNRNYEVEKELLINSGNPENKKYSLYFKYVGGSKNA